MEELPDQVHIFLYVHPENGPPNSFGFQFLQGVWGMAAKLQVHTAVEGSNASILAYGQTSSGKTHSVTGISVERCMGCNFF